MQFIEPIAALPALREAAPVQAAAPAPGAAFASWMTDNLNDVNARLSAADQAIQGAALGTPQNLHEVMIQLEEARLSFQLLTQVRNKLLEAYQEVMRTQV